MPLVIPSAHITDGNGNTVTDQSNNYIGDTGVDMNPLLALLPMVAGGSGGAFWDALIGAITSALINEMFGEPVGHGVVATIDDLAPINDALGDWTNSFDTVKSYFEYITSTHNINLQDVIDAIGVGGPIELPETWPEGWNEGVSEAIWNPAFQIGTWVQTPYNLTMGSHLAHISQFVHSYLGAQGIMDPRNTDFSLVYYTPAAFSVLQELGYIDVAPDVPDPIDWTLWTPGTTLADFLNAQESKYTWGEVLAPGQVTQGVCWAQIPNFGGYPIYYRCNVEEWMLPLKAGVGYSGTVSNAGAPVWPGLDNVTLGESISIDTGVTIDTPCDGLIIDIQTVPAPVGHYTFDTALSHMHVGAVAFYSDNGAVETAQNFSFDSHVLVPRAIQHPAGCYIRAKAGVVGLITPWTVNA